MNHTIDDVTMAEGLAELREQGAQIAGRAAAYRADGDHEAADALDGATDAVRALADAIETGREVGAALVASTRAYEHVMAVLAARRT
jgi:hypothetical protein